MLASNGDCAVCDDAHHTSKDFIGAAFSKHLSFLSRSMEITGTSLRWMTLAQILSTMSMMSMTLVDFSINRSAIIASEIITVNNRNRKDDRETRTHISAIKTTMNMGDLAL